MIVKKLLDGIELITESDKKVKIETSNRVVIGGIAYKNYLVPKGANVTLRIPKGNSFVEKKLKGGETYQLPEKKLGFFGRLGENIKANFKAHPVRTILSTILNVGISATAIALTATGFASPLGVAILGGQACALGLLNTGGVIQDWIELKKKEKEEIAKNGSSSISTKDKVWFWVKGGFRIVGSLALAVPGAKFLALGGGALINGANAINGGVALGVGAWTLSPTVYGALNIGRQVCNATWLTTTIIHAKSKGAKFSAGEIAMFGLAYSSFGLFGVDHVGQIVGEAGISSSIRNVTDIIGYGADVSTIGIGAQPIIDATGQGIKNRSKEGRIDAKKQLLTKLYEENKIELNEQSKQNIEILAKIQVEKEIENEKHNQEYVKYQQLKQSIPHGTLAKIKEGKVSKTEQKVANIFTDKSVKQADLVTYKGLYKSVVGDYSIASTDVYNAVDDNSRKVIVKALKEQVSDVIEDEINLTKTSLVLNRIEELKENKKEKINSLTLNEKLDNLSLNELNITFSKNGEKIGFIEAVKHIIDDKTDKKERKEKIKDFLENVVKKFESDNNTSKRKFISILKNENEKKHIVSYLNRIVNTKDDNNNNNIDIPL